MSGTFVIDDVQDFELNEEQRQLRQDIKRFVEEEIIPLDIRQLEWRDDPHERVPWEVVDKGHQELNLMNFIVPEEDGGVGAGPLTMVMAVEELTYGDMGVGHLFTHTWKWSKRLLQSATEEQREEFLDRFIDDPRHVMSACMTEPDHGSDNALGYEDYTLDTTAEKDGDEWVINGKKRFITNGADSKTLIVFAQTDPGVPAPEGTTSFIVTRDYDGLEVTHIHEKISQRLYNNATLEFDNLRVHEDQILGELHKGMQVGDLLKESHLEAAATTLGTARRAYEEAFEYAHERVQGGRPIIEHQSIGHDFAKMSTELQAARGTIWTAARAIEQGAYTEDLSPKAKLYAAEISFDVAKRALEKFGGAGIMLETNRPMQKYLRDCLSYLHSDGTQEVQKEKIIRSLREQARG